VKKSVEKDIAEESTQVLMTLNMMMRMIRDQVTKRSNFRKMAQTRIMVKDQITKKLISRLIKRNLILNLPQTIPIRKKSLFMTQKKILLSRMRLEN